MRFSKKALSIILSVLMILTIMLPASADEAANVYYSDNYKITKISNPTTGSGEPDGLLYGDAANRINSYAWSTAYRDGYLYIGVNRNFLNVAISTFGTGIDMDIINEVETILTRGELPPFRKDERQAMILKLNPETSETEIIYQPPYLEQYDVYLDAAYRNVIEYKGDLYYGTMGAVTTRILRVDKDDNVTVAFSGGAGASFRSSAVYNDELYFAGFDTRITDNVNEYGWVWTEVIGKNSDYYPGMAPTAAGYPYGGAVASSATPVVYNGKLYVGTFDYATKSLAAIIKQLVPYLKGNVESMKLSQLLAPLYYSITHPQKLYEVDADDNVTEVTEFNKLMEGNSNEYIWRFQEYDGKLFISTFDAEPMYKYVTQITDGFLASLNTDDVMNAVAAISNIMGKIKGGEEAQAAVDGIADSVAQGDAQAISESVAEAQELIDDLPETEETGEAKALLNKIISLFDMKGLSMYLEISQYMVNNTAGFDLYATSDMKNFDCITLNGFDDEYNYGARTFAPTEDGLYIGTANPFYGAQVWKLEDLEEGEVIGKDVTYSLNMTDKLVSPAYEGTKAGTICNLFEDDNFMDTFVTDAEGNRLGRNDTLTTGDILNCTATITLSERTIFEYTVVVLGDTDCNGKVSAADARLALRLAAGLDKAEKHILSAADADMNGKVTAADARTILRAAASMEKLTIA